MSEITVVEVQCCNPDFGRPQYYFNKEGKIVYGPCNEINNLTRATTDVVEFAKDAAFIMRVLDWQSLIPGLEKLKEDYNK
jgi:hypothetical protein